MELVLQLASLAPSVVHCPESPADEYAHVWPTRDGAVVVEGANS